MGQGAAGGELNCADVGTCGMMVEGETPNFYVYDSSLGEEIQAHNLASDGTALQNIPAYEAIEFDVTLRLDLVTDCNGDMGGSAVYDLSLIHI